MSLHEGLNSKYLSSLGRLSITVNHQTNSDLASVLSSILCPPHGLPKKGWSRPCALASCVDTQNLVLFSCLVLEVQPSDPLHVCGPQCVFYVLAIFYVLIFWCWFSHHSHVFVFLCVCICAAAYVSHSGSLMSPIPSSFSALFRLAVRSSRRTTIRESISRCGSNVPRSWGSRPWRPAARPCIMSWILTTAGRQGQGGRSTTM